MRRHKKNIERKVIKLNRELKVFCEDNLIDYISNDCIDKSCLGNAKLHPNKKNYSFWQTIL